MMDIVYVVKHNMGDDGNHIVTAFSNKDNAKRLCALYNGTDNSDEYDFYSYSEVRIDEYNVDNCSIDEDADGWKALKFNG